MTDVPPSKEARYAINKNIGDWQRKKFKKGIITEAAELARLNKDMNRKISVSRSTRSHDPSYKTSSTPRDNSREHAVNIEDDANILHLPKLPFGKHDTYNNEKHFVAKHFVKRRGRKLSSKKFRDIKEVQKTAKRNKKRNSKRACLTPDFSD